MPLGQIEAFSELAAEWHGAERESDKRAVWRALARGGWLRACREAVQRGDRAILEAWLDKGDATKQDLVQFQGEEVARMVRTHLRCSLAACWAQAVVLLEPSAVTVAAPRAPAVSAVLELLRTAWEAVASQSDTAQSLDVLAQELFREARWPGARVTAAALADLAFCLLAQHRTAPVSGQLPLGFFRDLTQDLLGEPPRKAERDLSLTVLLVDRARNEGVVATLTLELMPDGSGGFYPIPELALIRDPDFRQAQDDARAYSEGVGLWQKGRDVRWRLHRRDGKPIINLTGPSIGAPFALGLVKLFAEE